MPLPVVVAAAAAGTGGTTTASTVVTSLVTGLAMMAAMLGGEKAISSVNQCSAVNSADTTLQSVLDQCKAMQGERIGTPAIALDPDAEVQRSLETARADVSRRAAPGVTGTAGADLEALRAAILRADNNSRKVYGFLRKASYCDHVKARVTEARNCLASVYNSRKRVFQDICRYSAYKDSPLCKAGFPAMPQ